MLQFSVPTSLSLVHASEQHPGCARKAQIDTLDSGTEARSDNPRRTLLPWEVRLSMLVTLASLGSPRERRHG